MQKSPLNPYHPNFDFGLISDLEVSNDFTPPPRLEHVSSTGRNDEQPPAKRRKRNPKIETILKDSTSSLVSALAHCATLRLILLV